MNISRYTYNRTDFCYDGMVTHFPHSAGFAYSYIVMYEYVPTFCSYLSPKLLIESHYRLNSVLHILCTYLLVTLKYDMG